MNELKQAIKERIKDLSKLKENFINEEESYPDFFDDSIDKLTGLLDSQDEVKCLLVLGSSLLDADNVDENNFQRGRDYIEKAFKKAPASTDTKQAMIDILNQEADFDGAFELWESIEDVSKDSLLMRMTLANIYRSADRYLDEEDVYKKAIKDEVESDELFMRYADLLLDHNQLEEALVYYKKTLKLLPTFWPLMESISDIYRELQDYEKSLEWLEKSSKLSPHKVSSSDIKFGRIYYSLGRYEEAEKKYLQSLASDPELKSSCHQALFPIYFWLNRLEESARSFKIWQLGDEKRSFSSGHIQLLLDNEYYSVAVILFKELRDSCDDENKKVELELKIKECEEKSKLLTKEEIIALQGAMDSFPLPMVDLERLADQIDLDINGLANKEAHELISKELERMIDVIKTYIENGDEPIDDPELKEFNEDELDHLYSHLLLMQFELLIGA